MQPYAEKFYKSNRWKRAAIEKIKSVGGLCERCRAKGLTRPARMVHHKIYLTPENINDPEITLNFANLEALCLECHGEEHAKHDRKNYQIDEAGRVTYKEPIREAYEH